MILNTMVVDNDEISRLLVSKFVKQTDFLNLSYVIDNSIEAWNILGDEKNSDVDLIFLDIEMSEMSGIKVAKSFNNTYPVIFIASEKDCGIETFEGNVLDYLVKPVEYSRFLESVTKAKEHREKDLLYAEKESHIFVKSDSRLVRVPYQDLLFVEALADYVIFNTTKGKYIVHHTMKGIEKRLPISIFSRVHRSYIINRNKISHIEDFNISITDKMIPIGASYKEQFLNKINQL